MGNLLRLLARDEPPEPDVFVDFEHAQPTESELEVYNLTEKVLAHANYLLDDLRYYPGGSNDIRNAINNPDDSYFIDKAWQTILPLISRAKRYYDFALQLEQVVPLILWELCSGPLPAIQQLEEHQALAKQFAEIIDFVLRFDELKIATPAIQNDFSYYRRSLCRPQTSRSDCPPWFELEVCGELANQISLFYAQPTPMLSTLSRIASNFAKQNRDLPIENITDAFSTMAKVTRKMVEKPQFLQRFANEETEMLCLRVMVGSIILYDYVHPVGAFVKSSGVDIKATIKLLKQHPPHNVDNLINALRYTTKHFNDDKTPKSVKNLLTEA